MKTLVYGSVNIDQTFLLPHWIKQGETLQSISCTSHAGGKGANQAVALAKAGADAYLAARIGKDGESLLDILGQYGVNTGYVRTDPEVLTGKAFIQVTPDGQNSITLFPGANFTHECKDVDIVLSGFSHGDWIVLNNEINNIGYIMDAAYARGLRICFNPSPFAEGILQYPLQKVSLLIVNEIEGEALSGETDPEKSIKKLGSLYPSSEIVLTAGRRGSYCLCDGNMRYHDIIDYSDTVDTTAAGDTFLGYYLCSRMNGISPEGALHAATKASAITVTRQGAMESIPYAWELPED